MRPQKLTISRGRRTTVDYDDRSAEYRDYNRNRWKYDKQVKQFYNSKLWRETSKQVLLQNDYVCAMCGGEATMTDHIISVKKDWNKRLDWNNLQASCKACNDSKAIRERCKNN
ncbi:TPA: HNH endonuclease [Streptococcus agalactiae]|uniref:HNH endonuclease n=1 Tax=Streptococcus agalactiae TaxID=1311 RepID=UPI00123CB23D|nr:HNH endonuclease signature motif containing protein [Streptococcus agalactiae]KAA9108898.1 HNH endonuclease [Streptococcus agalactiae]MCW1783179.1 HNH endonuclease [Streptococcus agalactiae]HEN2840577.1 HNH endonuclease [Streptococcus agalactiae]HEN8953075.1 HNH endonuclease [Streptococcus agalactiae]HEN9084109.1 HNH endonuclease [Streptococcus agalactiae]